MNLELRNDDPLSGSNVEDDILGYHDIAKNWAKIISEVSRSKNNFNFSIEGKWGSGKTTIINFMIEEIKAIESNQKIYSGEKRYIIDNQLPELHIEYMNPWRITGIDSMIIEFFKTLARNTALERQREFKTAIKSLLTRTLPIASYVLTKNTETLSSMLGKILDTETIEESYQKIYSYFSTGNLRKIIFIDDIDRLEKNEALTIFKAIKLFGNFPGVNFILSFDRDRIKVTHGKTDETDEFLEKFINHRFFVPASTPIKSTDYFMEQISRLMLVHHTLSAESKRNFALEKDHLFSAEESFRKIVPTIRQAKRILNYFQVEISKTNALNINILDFILIKSLVFKLGPEAGEKITKLSIKYKNSILQFTDKLEQFLSEVAPELKDYASLVRTLFDTSRRYDRYRFIEYNDGGEYLSEDFKIINLLRQLANETNDIRLIDMIKPTRLNLQKIIEMIRSSEMKPESISQPLKFSFEVFKFCYPHLGNSDFNFLPHWTVKYFIREANTNPDSESWCDLQFDRSISIFYRNFFNTKIQEEIHQKSNNFTKIRDELYAEFKHNVSNLTINQNYADDLMHQLWFIADYDGLLNKERYVIYNNLGESRKYFSALVAWAASKDLFDFNESFYNFFIPKSTNDEFSELLSSVSIDFYKEKVLPSTYSEMYNFMKSLVNSQGGTHQQP